MSFSNFGILSCSDAPTAFLHLFDFSIAPPLLYYSYIPIVGASLLIGFFVYINNKHLLQARLLLLVTLSFVGWVLNILFQWIAVPIPVVMFAWQLTALFEVGVYLAAFYFAYVFVYKQDLSLPLKVGAALILLGTAALLPSPLNIQSFDLANCQGNLGTLWNILYAFEPAIIIFTVLIGLDAFRKEKDAAYKKQILILTMGMGLFLGAFYASNYYGELSKVYEFNFFGPLGMFAFIVLIGYLVVEFKAFNVKLIAAQALVTGTVLLIGSEYFFIQNRINYALVTGTLILTTIFGYLLVRSVKREVEQRERIELLAHDLEQANKQQIALIHFITHQLKGFVAKSRGIFSMLQEGDYGAVPAPMKPIIDEGFSSATKGAQTIQDILNASNIKNGKMAYQMASFDFKALVDSILRILKPNADAKNVALTVTEPSEPVMLIGDQMQLENAIKNLVDNTIKYTQQGSIKVTLTNDGSMVRFMTEDTGVGITPEDMKHLFTEGGHGAESQKVNVDSTGFGLYIVKNIIEAHGGKVWAESEGAGKGSKFIVELPVSQSGSSA